MNQPLVSIIIPSYNHEKYVEQAIMSIIDQTYRNLELIIIDDGSVDESPYVIKELVNKIDSSKKIIFEIQDNMGLSKTLNKAIRMANGEYIAILASDDMYLPNKIEECVNVLSNAESNVCAVFSNGFIINENGVKMHQFYDNKHKKPWGKNVYKELLLGNWIAALSLLYRKSSLLECGLFDENLEIEDYDMLLRLAKIFELKYISKPLVLYRMHGLNCSNNKEKMNEHLESIYKKHKDLYSYKKYTLALKNKNIIQFLQECNLLNIELTLRAIIRIVRG